MAITDADVLHVARLARLRLDEDEVGRMRAQLATILDHVQALSDLVLAGVEPTAHALDLRNVVRADGERPSLSREDALASAPAPLDGAFMVPPA